MSVDLEALMISGGIDPQRFVTTPKYRGSVAFTADTLRSFGLWIGYNPIKDVPGVADNRYHGEVWSGHRGGRFSGPQETGLITSARWYVTLPNVDLR